MNKRRPYLTEKKNHTHKYITVHNLYKKLIIYNNSKLAHIRKKNNAHWIKETSVYICEACNDRARYLGQSLTNYHFLLSQIVTIFFIFATLIYKRMGFHFPQ
jgi:hypothetical protein